MTNDWDGVIAVEEDPTADNRRIVAGALTLPTEPIPAFLSEHLREEHPEFPHVCGRATRIWRQGKLIKGEGWIEAPPGTYYASIGIHRTDRVQLRVHEDHVRGRYTVLSGAIKEVVLIPEANAVWPQVQITVYDGANPDSHDEQVRRTLTRHDEWLESGVRRKHYTDATTCEHGEPLHVGWLELGQEAARAQAVLDTYGIPNGLPQGKGDLDWRVTEAMFELTDTRMRLSSIALAHAREKLGETGLVGEFCTECGRKWPCPTYLWASGERSGNLPFDPMDDETDDA